MAASLASEAHRPEWTKRSTVKEVTSRHTWFLGVDNETEDDFSIHTITRGAQEQAEKNLNQLVYPRSIMYMRSLLVTELKDTKSKTTVTELPRNLAAPIDKKRVYCHEIKNDRVCYVDIAVLNTDIQKVKTSGKAIYFERDYKYEERLEKNTTYVNDIIEKKLTILDKPHTFTWSPLRSDTSAWIAFGYSYSFLNRRLHIGYNFSQHNESDEDSDAVGINYDGDEYFDKVNHEYYIGLSIYKSPTTVLSVQVGLFSELQVQGIENSYEGDNDYREDQFMTGTFIGLKYLHFTHFNNKMGYKLQINLEGHEGEDFNGDFQKEQKIKSSAGLVWIF